jgi:hypothetical protein
MKNLGEKWGTPNRQCELNEFTGARHRAAQVRAVLALLKIMLASPEFADGSVNSHLWCAAGELHRIIEPARELDRYTAKNRAKDAEESILMRAQQIQARRAIPFRPHARAKTKTNKITNK